MNKRLTIYDIKYAVSEKSPYFFSRKSMRFFNQTLRDFHVRKSPSGKIFIFAPSTWDNRLMGYTFREFIDNDLVNPHGNFHSITDVENYINSH